ncbi:MAG: tetratricopeptide repeat protein [Treponema sp.]|jgi:tetratricopeptide (TPR) repeat protein|nr:tetratricopeptide repeat protein [Treponema sp.]
MEPETYPKSPFLRVICIVGLVLALAILGILCFLFFSSKGRGATSTVQTGNSLYQGLQDFDTLMRDAPEQTAMLNATLNLLGKQAVGVESHLSVLKRRRLLAQQDPRFLPQYQQLAQEAAAAFPVSEPLAAVAVESLLMGNAPVHEETAAQLTGYASRLSGTTLSSLALGVYILTGTLADPTRAALIPNKEVLFSATVPGADLTINLMVLRVLDKDIAGVTTQLNGLLSPSAGTAEEPIRRFAAEFFYDYGDPLRAARLFSQFSDETSMVRQADALWLSNHISNARNIWTILVSAEQAGKLQPDVSTIRSLYNLAVTASDPKEERSYLERIFRETQQQEAQSSYYEYAIIRYTRLLDTSQSIALLEQEQSRHSPLLDLELLRRRRDTWSLAKTVGETWLLLGQYPEDPRLYQWGAYFFDFQRQYDETALLLKNAGYHHISGPWVDLHEGLRLIREGHLEEGQQRLDAIRPLSTAWQVPANIAWILESRRSTAAALDLYKTAASLVRTSDKEAAAKIQFRIGHCLRTLGRQQESRQALEEALALNPDYLNARLELRRLDSQGIY